MSIEMFSSGELVLKLRLTSTTMVTGYDEKYRTAMEDMSVIEEKLIGGVRQGSERKDEGSKEISHYFE